MGVDLSEQLCSLAQQRTLALVMTCDAEKLPFKDGAFRTVFMTEVLEHLLAPEQAFLEIHRVLACGGEFILTVPNRDWPRYNKYLGRRKRFQPVDDRFYRLTEIETLARNTGFHVRATGGYGCIWHGGLGWEWVERLVLSVHPASGTRRKRLFVKMGKSAD
jgi:ubiquinone/menaquinone biosynthesis C-methylase UbiE